MLTKDTLLKLPKRFERSLSSKHAMLDRRVGFRVRIPQDKLDLLVGMRLEDRYYVMSLLGKGGMSLVYKAKDLKTGEVVAVKCLRTQVLGDEMVVKRFQREADVLNRLNHPRIVSFYGYGTNRRGQPYFVMDYLVGTSLGEILRKQGHLDLGRFQDIFVQVAAAIGHAHKHDAVHRDLKPGNIMLVEKGTTSDYVKIVDFGIAKVTEGTQKLTRLGEVWGSPIYMSPEQCMGTTIDARTDIYSLGIVMYEALTGEVPFLGRNYADTMMKQISEEPPTFKQSNPKLDIPSQLEQIVFRAIKKKPDERYQSMNDLRHDLERALNQSLGQTPKQTGPMLTLSGRQKTVEQPQPKTGERAGAERPLADIQQKITSEDIPRFASNERLSQTDLPKPLARHKADAPHATPSPDPLPQARGLNVSLHGGLEPQLPTNPSASSQFSAEATMPPHQSVPAQKISQGPGLSHQQLESGHQIPPLSAPGAPQPMTSPSPSLDGNMDFAPPEEPRIKFELTGPQVISASTESDTRSRAVDNGPPPGSHPDNPRVPMNRINTQEPRWDTSLEHKPPPKRTQNSRSDNSETDLESQKSAGSRKARERTSQGRTIDNASGSRRARTSRNRLPASMRDTLTITQATKRSSGNSLNQILLIIVCIVIAATVGFLNRDYLSTMVKEVFFFPSEEKSSIKEEEEKKSQEADVIPGQESLKPEAEQDLEETNDKTQP
jgi:serine/threonine protein kinase